MPELVAVRDSRLCSDVLRLGCGTNVSTLQIQHALDQILGRPRMDIKRAVHVE